MLTKPWLINKGINLAGFAYLRIPPEKIANFILSNPNMDEDKLEFYIKLLKQTENGKRQKSVETIYERLDHARSAGK